MAGNGAGNGMGILQEISNGLTALVEMAGPSIVRVNARPGVAGTGIVWRADGLILTASHVVQQEDDITVGFSDGSTADASLVGRDQRTDLALLRVEKTGLTPISMVADGDSKPGSLVVAVGRPWKSSPVVSMGVISAVGLLGGGWRGSGGEEAVYSNVVLYPGFSGGPLLNPQGHLVGMNTSTLGRGASVAIPAATVQRVLGQIASAGRVKRGYLGIVSQPVQIPEALKKAASLEQDAGLLVLAVEPGSPADKGGLLLGDVLVRIGAQPVRSADDIQQALPSDTVGVTAKVRVLRGGNAKELSVLVGERPASS